MGVTKKAARKRGFLILLLSLCPALGSASPLVSAWGFRIDLPEEYQYIGGDGRDNFSFQSATGAAIEVKIYPGSAYSSVSALGDDIQRRLKNQGTAESFEYRAKQALLLELRFALPGSRTVSEGWGLCLELDRPARSGDKGRPLLLALAYGPGSKKDFQKLYFSALDSISPTPADWLAPGPITEYLYPRGERHATPIAGVNAEALVYEHDAEAAQYLVDREFAVLSRYQESPYWKEAWSRFYRAVYRDSFDRLAHIAFTLERHWNIPSLANRDLADAALHWVQDFQYERDLMGSDFVNLVTAATDGRGDCDSRALLWAILLEQANIPTAIMVSATYSHAMGLADLPGTGAHFRFGGKSWLVAETTTDVPIGLIAANVSDSNHWIGIAFE